MTDPITTVRSATIRGVEALPVEVEAYLSRGIPGIVITGMPDAMVRESVIRVRSAIASAGFSIPRCRITINLSPARLRKTGTAFDLPIAAVILVATNQVSGESLKDCLLVGELSLSGEIRPVPGIIAYRQLARADSAKVICAPSDELSHDTSEDLLLLGSLTDLRSGNRAFKKPSSKRAKKQSDAEHETIDFSEVRGQQFAKRALVIAAAGKHGALMIGSPGSGKTMLAQRFSSILPPLTEKQMDESARIHSVAGRPIVSILNGVPPFISPHHSASQAGLIGGGNPIKPGEITLAHNGVLFLDELAEFKPSVLQALRQPIETGVSTIVRAEGSVEMPARFQLLAATNPCPCGYLFERDQKCKCSEAVVRRYQSRIGGPILDRFDISFDVIKPPPHALLHETVESSSVELREQVIAARQFADERKCRDKAYLESDTGTLRAVKECRFKDEAVSYFEKTSVNHRLTGRGIIKLAQVARTIADLEESFNTNKEHLQEAISYRRGLW